MLYKDKDNKIKIKWTFQIETEELSQESTTHIKIGIFYQKMASKKDHRIVSIYFDLPYKVNLSYYLLIDLY